MKPLAKTITHTLAAFGLVGAALTPALATEVEPMAIEVKLSDIDLDTAKGQRTLERRLEKAVRTVCRAKSPNTGTRLLSQDAKACLAKARSDAKRQMAAMISNQQRGG